MSWSDLFAKVRSIISSQTPAVPVAPAPVIRVAPVAYKPTSSAMQPILDEICNNEGGYVDDPQDAGGITNYGISVNFAKDHVAFFDLNHDGVVDGMDIKALTPTLAKQAYMQFFIQPAKLDTIPDGSTIRMQLCDLAVNSGVRYSDGHTEAVIVLQRAVNAPVDGILGAGTLAILMAAIQTHGAIVVNNSVVDQRIAFYKKVVAAHPEDQKFLAGWEKRANKYRKG